MPVNRQIGLNIKIMSKGTTLQSEAKDKNAFVKHRGIRQHKKGCSKPQNLAYNIKTICSTTY